MHLFADWKEVAIFLFALFVVGSTFFLFERASYPGFSGAATTSSTATINLTIEGNATEEETATNATAGVSSGVGGGGKGAAGTRLTDFSVNPSGLRVSAEAGERVTRIITIANTGAITASLKIYTNIPDIVKFSTEELSLAPGQEAQVRLTIGANEPGIYTGKLFVENSFTQEVGIVLEVSQLASDLSISLKIPDIYRSIVPGEELVANIIIEGKVNDNVNVDYVIKDGRNQVVFEDSEIVFVNNKKEFEKVFSLPVLKQGTYVLGVSSRYKKAHANAAEVFTVVEGPSLEFALREPTRAVADYSLLILVVLITIAYLHWREYHKKRKM